MTTSSRLAGICYLLCQLDLAVRALSSCARVFLFFLYFFQLTLNPNGERKAKFEHLLWTEDSWHCMRESAASFHTHKIIINQWETMERCFASDLLGDTFSSSFDSALSHILSRMLSTYWCNAFELYDSLDFRTLLASKIFDWDLSASLL